MRILVWIGIFAGISLASLFPSEVVTLPVSSNYGGGDTVGSKLVAPTYNPGKGPGIWIVADGGYRLYVNGELLKEDDQAGRVGFVPYTFLPGENAVSVVAVNGSGAPGVLVQIDELEKSYYSGSGWVSKPAVGNSAWKEKGRDLSAWGGATVLNYSSSKMPSGSELKGFAENTEAKWIWTGSETDSVAVLLYTFHVRAEGFGENTTGGADGEVVVATDSASVRKALQSKGAKTILIPEGTYDFRIFKNAVTDAQARGWTWCKGSCGANDKNSGNTFYRISFTANSCSGLSENVTQVSESENLMSWNNWITTSADKSLVGMGRGANLRGAAINPRSYENGHNNIYRNLALYDVNPHLVEAGDGLSVDGASDDRVKNFWADHISYKWISDGFDIGDVSGATVSYLDYDGSSEYNCWGYDPYMALVQNAELTYANVYWHGTYGRVPKAGGNSRVHLYNNYTSYNYWTGAAVSGDNSSSYTQMLYENSYLDQMNYHIVDVGNYGYLDFTRNTVKNSKGCYYVNGSCTSTAPSANVFSPSYSYEKRNVETLPTELPNLAGVGGKWGKMPEYDQPFGMSPLAADVRLEASPLTNSVTLSASVKSSGGAKIQRVDFYIGTELVASKTAEPYSAEISELSAGTYSAIAVATDANGLQGVSAHCTFLVSGEKIKTVATLTKNGAGPSNQEIFLGDTIVPFSYVWANAATVSVEGLPRGILVRIDSLDSRVSISGAPLEAGEFTYTVSTVGADSNATVVRTLRVKDSDGNLPTAIFSGRNSLPENVAKYRVFDMQGRLFFEGKALPKNISAVRSVVVGYGASGKILMRVVMRGKLPPAK